MPKNNKVALIVMIVVMILSSSISAVGAMNKMSKDIKNNFFVGEEQYDTSIYRDLNKKTVIATNVANLARYYIAEKDDHLKAVTDTLQAMTNESSVSKLFKLNSTLDDNVNYLITQLNGMNLSETHRKMLTGYEAEYKSRNRTISNETYNSLVEKYYEETSGFPGIIFRIFAKNPEYFK